jgi:spermidine/putrescine transport system permease protein
MLPISLFRVAIRWVRMLIEYTHPYDNWVTLHASVVGMLHVSRVSIQAMEMILQFFRRRPGYRAATLLTGSLFWLIGFFLLPLAYLLAVSFAQRSPYGTIDWTLGLANYARAFQPLYLQVYARSLWMALLTTGLCALLGYPVAYTLALRVSTRWKSALLMFVVIPFWTSFLIRTYAWMIILRSEGVVNNALLALHVIHEPLRLLYSPLAVIIGLVYGELPFMILPLYAVLQKLDPALLEAAEDLGAPWWPSFLRVTLPLSAPGLVAGSILVFIASVGAFVTPDLLGGARTMMVGNLIQNQFAVARDQPFGSAVAFLLTFVVLALVAAGLRKSEHSTGGIV